MKRTLDYKIITTAALASVAFVTNGHSQSADALVNKLVQKGILTEQEAKDLVVETIQTNQVSASKWKISDAIKNIQLFGDLRFRYEYRAAENAPGSGVGGDTFYRERFRYAVRIGLRGDLFDNFYYGLRLETGSNPRSPWVTFGDNGSSPTPFAKNNAGINVGQAYLGWRPTDWYEMTVGKMPMPLYVTPMIWDGDLNPEGAAEKFKYSLGAVDLFATFGQFDYQNTNPAHGIPSSDTFLLAWQLGGNVKFTKDMSLKIAPVLYNYTGLGQINGLNTPFSGQGRAGLNTNPNGTFIFNQSGINDLLVLETPAEFNFKVAKYNARVFGDFAYNFDGDARARAAVRATATPPGGNLPRAITDENKAYQIGVGFGNLGLVYGQTSKKGTWEARAYWQHIEQYAVDVNLVDSDFFERANLEGVYAAFAYSFTDCIIGTVRYGYASPINNRLGTGGNNSDLVNLNPIRDYNLVQLDLTWRF
jgi:hypothetical protein